MAAQGADILAGVATGVATGERTNLLTKVDVGLPNLCDQETLPEIHLVRLGTNTGHEEVHIKYCNWSTWNCLCGLGVLQTVGGSAGLGSADAAERLPALAQ